jgi:diguanylate cyclase (GGDEF)-like protein/PAS domain S-box-containing protein
VKDKMTSAPRVLGEAEYEAILSGVSEGVYVTDRNREILFWNPACEEITGYGRTQAVGSHCFDSMLVHVDSSGRHLCDEGCPLAATLDDGLPREAEVFLHHREGHRLPVRVRTRALRSSEGEIVAAVETFDTVADKIAALEQVKELQELVYLDALTGIANRRFLQQAIDSRIAEQRRYGWVFGLIMMDVDHFKAVNDTYGHEAGDLVLQMIGTTLRMATRSFDVVGRWGGEEFLVVAANATDQELEIIAERYRMLIENSDVPVAGAGAALRVTISAGASMVKERDDAVAAMDRVDKLLYRSKSEGRNRVSLGDPGATDEGEAPTVG